MRKASSPVLAQSVLPPAEVTNWNTYPNTDCYESKYDMNLYQGIKKASYVQKVCEQTPNCAGAVQHDAGDWWLLSGINPDTKIGKAPDNQCITKSPIVQSPARVNMQYAPASASAPAPTSSPSSSRTPAPSRIHTMPSSSRISVLAPTPAPSRIHASMPSPSRIYVPTPAPAPTSVVSGTYKYTYPGRDIKQDGNLNTSAGYFTGTVAQCKLECDKTPNCVGFSRYIGAEDDIIPDTAVDGFVLLKAPFSITNENYGSVPGSLVPDMTYKTWSKIPVLGSTPTPVNQKYAPAPINRIYGSASAPSNIRYGTSPTPNNLTYAPAPSPTYGPSAKDYIYRKSIQASNSEILMTVPANDDIYLLNGSSLVYNKLRNGKYTLILHNKGYFEIIDINNNSLWISSPPISPKARLYKTNTLAFSRDGRIEILNAEGNAVWSTPNISSNLGFFSFTPKYIAELTLFGEFKITDQANPDRGVLWSSLSSMPSPAPVYRQPRESEKEPPKGIARPFLSLFGF